MRLRRSVALALPAATLACVVTIVVVIADARGCGGRVLLPGQPAVCGAFPAAFLDTLLALVAHGPLFGISTVFRAVELLHCVVVVPASRPLTQMLC
jgi:hypothetical protein